MDFFKADWSPQIEQAVRAIAAVIVAVYVAGLITGNAYQWIKARGWQIAAPEPIPTPTQASAMPEPIQPKRRVRGIGFA